MALDDKSLALNGGPMSVSSPIPVAAYGAELIGAEEEAAVLAALRAKKLCRIAHTFDESYTAKFEEELRRVTGAPYLFAVNSCASALYIAMVMLAVGPGDEVLVAGAGWMSVASAAISVGAVPVPVEYTEGLTIDLDDLESKISPRTKAIVVIHWRGLPADMDRLMRIAGEHNLRVVEDCAQAFGGTYKGRALGTIGDIGCYSFNMHKIISGGEGGAVACRDGELLKRGMSFSGMYNFHRRWYDDGDPLGMPLLPMLNFRLPELCGAVAFAQVQKLDRILGTLRSRRRELLAGLQEIPALTVAPMHDPEGDCGYTIPLVFERPEQAAFFFRAMKAEGVPSVSNLQFSFGGAEARGTAALVMAEKFDPAEAGRMAVSDWWRCLTQHVGLSPALDPWKLAGGATTPVPAETVPKTKERLQRVVVLKTHVLMETEHTKEILIAATKVAHAMF
jgi:8-amino-3,8-dideoxy-alpha-D-manno-octulosonate transaminase